MMKRNYIKPVVCVLVNECELSLLSSSMGNDETTNDSSQGEDKDGDGVFGPGDVDSKGNIWDDGSWGNTW